MEIYLLFLIGSFLSGIVFADADPKKRYIGSAVAAIALTFIYFNFNSFI